MRSGGAGIAGFYTCTGVDTYVEQGLIPLKFEEGNPKPVKTSIPREVMRVSPR